MRDNITMNDKKIQPSIVDVTEDTKQKKVKPGSVNTIENFDIKNLTPENIEFMLHTVQDYFNSHFPVKEELVEQLPEKVRVVGTEEFLRMHHEVSGDEEIDVNFISGFYNDKVDKVFINKDGYNSPGALFATIFHECLHRVSIQEGAGFAGEFFIPADRVSSADERMLLYMGLNTLKEGTTTLIALNSVIKDMGFDKQDQMFSYEPERFIVEELFWLFSQDDMFRAYFNTPNEEIRMHVEKNLEPNEELRNEISHGASNGIFTSYIQDIGTTTNYVGYAMEELDYQKLADGKKAIREMVAEYLAGYYDVNNIEPDDKIKEYVALYGANEEISNV